MKEFKFNISGKEHSAHVVEHEDTLGDRVLHQLIDDLARAMIDIKKKAEGLKND